MNKIIFIIIFFMFSGLFAEEETTDAKQYHSEYFNANWEIGDAVHCQKCWTLEESETYAEKALNGNLIKYKGVIVDEKYNNYICGRTLKEYLEIIYKQRFVCALEGIISEIFGESKQDYSSPILDNEPMLLYFSRRLAELFEHVYHSVKKSSTPEYQFLIPQPVLNVYKLRKWDIEQKKYVSLDNITKVKLLLNSSYRDIDAYPFGSKIEFEPFYENYCIKFAMQDLSDEQLQDLNLGRPSKDFIHRRTGGPDDIGNYIFQKTKKNVYGSKMSSEERQMNAIYHWYELNWPVN